MIKAENLTKRFYDTVAVDHIHAEIHNGSVFGLIGTNGAGKSTFLRMAAGILKPDEGSITVDDVSSVRPYVRISKFSIHSILFIYFHKSTKNGREERM